MKGSHPTELPRSQAPIRWLWNGPVDLMVGCGLWTLPLLLASAALPSDGLLTGALVFQALCLICNNPHYAATIARVYSHPDIIRDHRWTTIYGTLLIVAAGAFAVYVPALIPLIFTVYITWSPFHYTGQNYGIAAMFQGRSGIGLDSQERRLIKWGFFLSYALWALGAHSGASANPAFLNLGIPPAWAEPLRLVVLVAYGALLIPGVTSVVLRAGWKRSAPLLFLVLTQTLWFALPAALMLFGLGGNNSPAYFSSGALAFMHCAQYLWITAYAARREAEAQGTPPPSQPLYFVRYLLPLVGLGILLFVPGPWLLSRVGGLDFVSAFLLVSSLVNIHHFMIDGVIWKLRDRNVSAVLVDGHHAVPQPQTRTAVSAFPAHWVWRLSAGALVILAAGDLAYHAATQSGAPNSWHRLAARANPNDGRHEVRLAREAAQMGNKEEAIRHARAAVNQAPYSDAQFLLGTLLIQAGQTTEALKHYRQQVTMVRPDTTTYLNYGVLSATTGDTVTALNQLQRIARLEPRNPDARINLAEALLSADRASDAVAHFDAALELLLAHDQTEPTQPDSQAVALAYRSALALKKAGRTADAEKRLLEANALAQKLQSETASGSNHP